MFQRDQFFWSLDTLEREKIILPLAGIEPLLPCCPEDLHLTFHVS